MIDGGAATRAGSGITPAIQGFYTVTAMRDRRIEHAQSPAMPRASSTAAVDPVGNARNVGLGSLAPVCDRLGEAAVLIQRILRLMVRG